MISKTTPAPQPDLTVIAGMAASSLKEAGQEMKNRKPEETYKDFVKHQENIRDQFTETLEVMDKVSGLIAKNNPGLAKDAQTVQKIVHNAFAQSAEESYPQYQAANLAGNLAVLSALGPSLTPGAIHNAAGTLLGLEKPGNTPVAAIYHADRETAGISALKEIALATDNQLAFRLCDMKDGHKIISRVEVLYKTDLEHPDLSGLADFAREHLDKAKLADDLKSPHSIYHSDRETEFAIALTTIKNSAKEIGKANPKLRRDAALMGRIARETRKVQRGYTPFTLGRFQGGLEVISALGGELSYQAVPKAAQNLLEGRETPCSIKDPDARDDKEKNRYMLETGRVALGEVISALNWEMADEILQSDKGESPLKALAALNTETAEEKPKAAK